MRIGVLASGTGTILQSLIDDGLPLAVVVADRPCAAIERAQDAGVTVELVERTSFGPAFDREAYTEQLTKVLQAHDVELVVIAGFGTVVPRLPALFGGHVLNTHPSLLPAFKGWHAVRDALAAGVKVTGCTVHLVTDQVDEGPILAQEPVRVEPGDDEGALHERIKAVERTLYPTTIRAYVEGALRP
ncbi:MAG TPA: phosphoribosylglycinamide formyltransferase [Acidimicrobiales bacterium]|nr:phosphoribosylglycinamide formyltransferase [Acidimicrobiales bacterium]